LTIDNLFVRLRPEAPKHASERGRVATGAEQQATRLAVWRSGRGAWGRRVGKSGATGTLEVVLRGAGWSVDLDEVLRSRRAWWSWKQDPRRNGFRRTRVAGLEPERGQEVEVGRLAKAMLQHQLLVQAIEGFFGDARVSGVRSCGLRRPCAVCDGGLGRSRSHPRPGLRATNALADSVPCSRHARCVRRASAPPAT